ncbi:MAG: hypothetical protein AAGI38_00570 [Bacteroidota bacterium]
MSSKINVHLLLLALVGSLLSLACQQETQPQKASPPSTNPKEAAIIAGADYAVDVLLDKEGKSRCEYNIFTGEWQPYEEPWHTGQVIYALVEAYRHTGSERYLTAARKAGDWWKTLAIDSPPALKGMVQAIHGDDVGDFIVFATVSDGTAGLYRLSEATGDSSYAAVASRAAGWMLKHMCDLEVGLCYDNVDPETGEVMKDTANYYSWRPNTEGALFLDAFRFTGDSSFYHVFIRLSQSVVQRQDTSGLWMAFRPNRFKKGRFHPRFNLWYAEALIDAFEVTGDTTFLVAARKTVDRYLQYLQSDGSFYRENFLDGRIEKGSVTGSATAFIGLLAKRLHQHSAGNYQEVIARCENWLLKNQFPQTHPDPNLRGAFLNTWSRNKKGKQWLMQRDIGTTFAIRFLTAE